MSTYSTLLKAFGIKKAPPKIQESSFSCSTSVETIKKVGPVNEYSLKLKYKITGSKEVFESHVKFLLDMRETPPLMTLTLIEANPQRLGLGKLMMNLTARATIMLKVPSINVAMNTPEEHRFYTSVGLKAADKDIEDYRRSLDSNLSENEKEQQFIKQEPLLNKIATPKTVIAKTDESVNSKFSSRLLSSLDRELSKFTETIKTDLAQTKEESLEKENVAKVKAKL